jgi:hypothetical protein
VLHERPDLLVRNALLNLFQTFSIGYVTASRPLSYLSALAGLACCVLLLVTRRWLFVLAIAASSVTYALYHPPVPVYLFGTYLLTIGALVDLLRRGQNAQSASAGGMTTS